jgi:Transposase DDE domain
MTDFALAEEFLAAYDVSDAVATVTDADRQTAYWNEQHMDEAIANKHIPVLIPPDKGSRGTPRRGWVGGRYTWMRRVLATELGRFIYRKRKQTIEPLFGHTKHNRGVNRFHRRGRTAVRTEWRLLMATHNLTKLHRHRIAAVGPQPGPTAETPPITTDTMAKSEPPSNAPPAARTL